MIDFTRATSNEHTVLVQAVAELDRRLVTVLDGKRNDRAKADAEWKHYVCRELLATLAGK